MNQSHKPFFSILMPTRNRASLLGDSLRTALNQSFQSYEIVVSDNNSNDDTRAVVEQLMLTSDKIRYVNPGRDLSMCDNWEFVLEQARGEYIIYLCDDDGFLYDSLSCAHDLISKFGSKVLVWGAAYYLYPDIPDPEMSGVLHCDVMSGQLIKVSSDAAINGLCSFKSVQRTIPKMLNCAVAKGLVDQAREKTGIFFLPPFPDYSAACQLLSLTDSYHFIELPLYIGGGSMRSNAGFNYSRKEKVEEYLSLYSGDLLAGCPYPMRHLINPYLLATYSSFARLYPNRFRHPMDMDAYFESLFRELVDSEAWNDSSEEYEQLAKHMARHYGSSEQFQRLWQQHELRKQAPQNGNSHVAGPESAQSPRRDSLPLRIARRAKRLIIPQPPPAPPKWLRFSDVQSLSSAAELLKDALPSMARSLSEITVVRVETVFEWPQPNSS